jgi:hypothetical protein
MDTEQTGNLGDGLAIPLDELPGIADQRTGRGLSGHG